MNTEPIFRIGKSSITPEFTQAVSEALAARELVKIAVLQNCTDDCKQQDLSQDSTINTSIDRCLVYGSDRRDPSCQEVRPIKDEHKNDGNCCTE